MAWECAAAHSHAIAATNKLAVWCGFGPRSGSKRTERRPKCSAPGMGRYGWLGLQLQQLARGGAEALDAAQLDLLVAANHVRQLGKLHGALVGRRSKATQR